MTSIEKLSGVPVRCQYCGCQCHAIKLYHWSESITNTSLYTYIICNPKRIRFLLAHKDFRRRRDYKTTTKIKDKIKLKKPTTTTRNQSNKVSHDSGTCNNVNKNKTITITTKNPSSQNKSYTSSIIGRICYTVLLQFDMFTRCKDKERLGAGGWWWDRVWGEGSIQKNMQSQLTRTREVWCENWFENDLVVNTNITLVPITMHTAAFIYHANKIIFHSTHSRIRIPECCRDLTIKVQFNTCRNCDNCTINDKTWMYHTENIAICPLSIQHDYHFWPDRTK